MTLRPAASRWCRTALSRSYPGIAGCVASRRASMATATTVPTPGRFEKAGLEVQRDARLPTPDPPADSTTSHLVSDHSRYMVATYLRPPPVMTKAEGCYLWDIDGRRYLDFTAGIAVNALGHCDKEIAKLLYQQATTLVHCSNLYNNAWVGELSRLLTESTRASGAMHTAAKVFVCNSGSEANEAAIKFARKVGKARDPSGAKHELVSFAHSFHGRTFGSLSATPNPKYQSPFAPMVPGFRTGEYNRSDGTYLEELITSRTCGVIVEPIQGEGGVNVASEAFLAALRRRCDEVGAVLIHDEIQSGLSRTGTLWAHGILPPSAHPDILTTAKALGNGYPVGATIVSEEIAECIRTGDHGTTFGGNPLACRIAHHIVSRLADPELQRGVVDKEKLFRARFAVLQDKYPHAVGELRGRGLILGLQLHVDPTPVVTAARERGLLIITAGTNTLRFLPPLVISNDEINEGMDILADAMDLVLGEGSSVGRTLGQQEMAPPGR